MVDRSAEPATGSTASRAGHAPKVWRFGVAVLHGIERHELSTRAAALTYGTLFSLVPMLAVAFAMFKAFGGLEQAKDVLLPRLLSYIAVGSHGVVEQQIDGFIQNIHGGAIGSVGTVMLLLGVVSLMSQMEHSIDRVWEVPVGRSFLQRAAMYWTTVTVAPTLVLAGVSLPTTLARFEPLAWIVQGQVGQAIFSVLVPLALVYLGFTTLYLLVPNTHVPIRAGVIGGVVGGSLWLTAVYGYALYASVTVTYSKIYGSLGALAIFLLWIYVTWMIVLLGAEVAALVDRLATLDDTDDVPQPSPAARELVALRVMSAIARSFIAGTGAVTQNEIALQIPLQRGLVAGAVAELRASDSLILEDATGRLAPARDPHGLSAAAVIAALRDHGDPARWHADDQAGREIETLGRRAGEASDRVWGAVTLEQLGI